MDYHRFDLKKFTYIMSITIIVLAGLSQTLAKTTSLYSGDKNIASLKNENFLAKVRHKDYLIVCNYYKHWSPTCQRFAGLFKNFAREIEAWSQVVKLVSIDCAEHLICHQVLKQDNHSDEVNFPLIQLIPPHTKDIDQHAKQYEIETMEELYKLTIEEITTNTFLSQKYSLMPIIAKTIQEICLTFNQPAINTENYAIVERTPSEFSAMVILDLINHRDHVIVKRFIGDHHLLNGLFSHHVNLPVILEISPTCQYRIIGNIKNLHVLRKEFVNSIKNRLIMDTAVDEMNEIVVLDDDDDDKVAENRINTVDDDNAAGADKVIKYNLSYVDLHNTLRYSLLHEITTRKYFNEKQVSVIKQIYSIILNYFPFDNENVRRFFKRMNGWLKNKHQRLDVVKYLVATKISDGFLKPMESWRHCNGSKPIYRGYPCGVWVLFHSMVVNEYNLTIAYPRLEPNQVLMAMRNYIGTFFTCSECRRYFLNVSHDLEHQLVHRNSSVIWLWKVHNQFNSRLAWDDLNDPFFPKYQFPTKEMCPKCIGHNGRFDEKEVLDFLCKFYSKTSIRNHASRITFISPTFHSLLLLFLSVAIATIILPLFVFD